MEWTEIEERIMQNGCYIEYLRNQKQGTRSAEVYTKIEKLFSVMEISDCQGN